MLPPKPTALRTVLRLVTPVVSLSLLAAYVVYSQRQADRESHRLIHGTKSTQILEDLRQTDSTSDQSVAEKYLENAQTPSAPAPVATVTAPGLKSLEVSAPPPIPGQPIVRQVWKPAFPGSKSGILSAEVVTGALGFDKAQQAQPGTPSPVAPETTGAPTPFTLQQQLPNAAPASQPPVVPPKRILPGSKSGGVFRPPVDDLPAPVVPPVSPEKIGTPAPLTLAPPVTPAAPTRILVGSKSAPVFPPRPAETPAPSPAKPPAQAQPLAPTPANPPPPAVQQSAKPATP